jgi:hypothetical protein
METAQRISTTLKPYVNTVCRIANGVLDALASPATAQGLTQGLMQSMPRYPSYPPPPFKKLATPPPPQQQQQMYRPMPPPPQMYMPPPPPQQQMYRPPALPNRTLVGGKKRRGKRGTRRR